MYSNAPWSTKHNREQRRGINHITTIKAHWRRKCRVKLKYLKGRYTSSWARREKRKPFPTHEVSQGTVPIWSSCPIKKDHCSKTTNEKQKINESVTSVILHYLGILRLFVSLNKTIGAFWPPKIQGLFPKKNPRDLHLLWSISLCRVGFNLCCSSSRWTTPWMWWPQLQHVVSIVESKRKTVHCGTKGVTWYDVDSSWFYMTWKVHLPPLHQSFLQAL